MVVVCTVTVSSSEVCVMNSRIVSDYGEFTLNFIFKIVHQMTQSRDKPYIQPDSEHIKTNKTQQER